MKSSEITINAIFGLTFITFILSVILIFRRPAPVPEPVPEGTGNYYIQKDSTGWRMVSEQPGKEKGSGVVTYYGYTDSLGVLKQLKSIITTKEKTITAKTQEKELENLNTLHSKLIRKLRE